MKRSQDATSSWSGYIFQGEVALCKAIEMINKLGGDSVHGYFLKLEEGEDFSLHTSEVQIFQVKAYTKHNYEKYRKSWNDMMNRFPDNSERNFMILQLGKIDFKKFEGVQQYDKVKTNIISGEYRLDNIIKKIDKAIKFFFNGHQIRDHDIEIKRIYSCHKISEYVNERHNTGNAKKILFQEIIKFLNNAPDGFNKEIAWYYIIKKFIEIVSKEIDYFDLEDQKERRMHDKLRMCVSVLETFERSKLEILINERLIPHKRLDYSDLRDSAMNFLNETGITKVIVMAIKEINHELDPEYMQFTRKSNNEHYQLTMDDEEFVCASSSSQIYLLQEHLEKIYKYTVSKDIDYYVTKHLNVSKEETKKHLIKVIPNEEDNYLFGFKNLKDAIKDLNE